VSKMITGLDSADVQTGALPDTGIADGPAWRNLKLNSAQRDKDVTNSLPEIFWRISVIGFA